MNSSSSYLPNSASATVNGSTSGNAGSSAAASPAAKTATGAVRTDDKADVLRDKVADTVQQLSRGWKSLSGLKDQARRHPLATILSSAAVLLAIGGSITVGVLENKRRNTFSYRLRKGMRNVKRQLRR